MRYLLVILTAVSLASCLEITDRYPLVKNGMVYVADDWAIDNQARVWINGKKNYIVSEETIRVLEKLAFEGRVENYKSPFN